MIYFNDDIFKNILSFCGETIEEKQKKKMKYVVRDFKELMEYRERGYESLEYMLEPYEGYFLQFREGCYYYDRGEFRGEEQAYETENELKIGKWLFGYGFIMNRYLKAGDMDFDRQREFRDMLVREGHDYFEVWGDYPTVY